MLLPLLIVFARLISTSVGSDVVLGFLGKTAFIECQLPISNTLVWQTQDGNVIAVNGKVTNENSTKYMIETQNGFRESLVIHNLTLADDKAFRCFDLKNSTYVDTTKLKVLARPIVMNITSTPTQPFLEETEVTFTCETDGAKPLPDIRWYIKFTNGSVTEVTGNITDIKYENGTGNRKNTFTSNITRDLYQATFICNITASLFYQETLILDTNVLLAPKQPEITSDNYNGSYDENSVVKLECMSGGSRPSPTIYWLLNGNRVGDVEVEIRPQNGTFTIQSNISKLLSRDYNGSVLTCAVTNKVLQDQGLPPRMTNITLLASYKPNVSLEQDEYTTKFGDNVTLRCHIDANPLPTLEHLYWTHKGAMVDRKYYTLSNGSDIFSLTLRDVKITDSGNYRCHAINRLGTSASEQIKLTVLYAPVCEFESVQKLAVRRGETARLNCNMFASPNGVIFTWRYKQTDERIRRIQATTDMKNSERVYSTLELTMGTQLRYAEIECYGSNARGISSHPCMYNVVPPGPAEVPSNCSTLVEDSQVQISCKAGFDGGSSQHFILQRLDGFEFETLLTGDTPDFTFYTYENVTVRMCAFNDDFRSMLTCAESTSVSVNVAAPPPSDPVKGKNSHKAAYIAGGVVASVGAITLAVIVALLLFRRYNKKKSTRNKNDLELGSTNQVTKSNKFDKWRKVLCIKRFTAPFRKSGTDQPATADIRERETITDINDNDEMVTDIDDNIVPHHHTSRLASTPYHPLKAYRIDRKENCVVINASNTQPSSKEQKSVPDVLNESTGFALSPILARNFSNDSRYRADTPVEFHSDVPYNHSFNERYNEMTDVGVSNRYNTDDMLDVLFESDDKILSRVVDTETDVNICVKTLDKEYTDGDIADVLDSTENDDIIIESDVRNESESDSRACDINGTALPNETSEFGDSMTVLKFMNVDFSAVSLENEIASRMNNLHEQSFAGSSELILLRSPISKSPDCNRDGRIARAFSLPYRMKRQQKISLNKVHSLSDILEPAQKSLQYENTHTWNDSLASYPGKEKAIVTVAMDAEEISDDCRAISVRRTDTPDAICDIDEFTLTINSEATIDYENNDGLDYSIEKTIETTDCSQIDDLSMMKSKSFDMPLDIDQFTLTINSEIDRESAAIGEAIWNDDHLNKTELHKCHNESIVDSTAESKREECSPRRDLLRRNSFLEAINNTEVDCSLKRSRSQDDKLSIKTDSETQGSYLNYGYEQDSDGNADYNIEGRDTHKKEESSDDNDPVNVVAYF